ncbi:MAG: HDOD domain-containing protein [Sterolibacterium sp.]|nr:HDOD domain-containing protein [Sterolibacterium sp.]
MGNAQLGTETLSRLLKLLDASPGFAGLGSAVQLVSQLADAEDGGTREIVAAILSDAALTARLLRIANSSRNARGGRNVSTIDQAIVILGLSTVKSVVLSLALLNTMANSPQARLLNGEIAAAYFCGSFCAELTRLNGARYSAQEAQVCGLMQNLGRMMVAYHLHEEIEHSRDLQVARNLTEDEAVRQTLGVGFEEIGAAIAAHWSLPDVLQQSLAMRKEKALPRSVNTPLDWHRYAALFSRLITDILFRLPEGREKIEIANEIEYFRLVLRLKDSEVHEWIGKILQETDQQLQALAFPCDVEQARTQLRKASERVLDLLSAQDSLTKESKDGRKPVEIFQQVLRQFHDKYGFDRSLLCLPDGSSGLVAVAGVGRNAAAIATRFRCQGAKPDIFRLVYSKKLDLYIADTQAETYAKHLPEWYASLVDARSIMLLSVIHPESGQPLALLYGDYAESRAQAPDGMASDPEIGAWRAELVTALQGQTSRN